MNNKESLLKGMQKAKDLCYAKLLEKFEEWGDKLINNALFEREYSNATGNTITSLAFGLYEHGQLRNISFIDGLNPPIRVKVNQGESIVLPISYDGKEDYEVGGAVDIVTPYGDELSIQTLMQLQPKRGFGIVVCTGTEYSLFLEDYGLNVLSETEQYTEIWSHSWFANLINNHPNRPVEKL